MSESNSKIEIWSIDDLKPYEQNAKKHPETQVNKLATAISKFGWTQPIVVWTNGEIIAGHGRRLAALKLGLKKVPVIVRRDLTKTEADALRLADNRVSSTEYDQEAIQAELQRLNDELSETDFDLTDLGFDQKEIDFIGADLGDIDDSFFVDDVVTAVEEQKTENERSIEKADDTAAPVVDALGFKRVTIAQSRVIHDAMLKIEQKTGKQGSEAFVEFMASI